MLIHGLLAKARKFKLKDKHIEKIFLRRKGWWICWCCIRCSSLLADRNFIKVNRTNATSFTGDRRSPCDIVSCTVTGKEQLCRAGAEVEKWLNTSQQCALEAKEAKHMPGCICKKQPAAWGTWQFPSKPHLWGHIWRTLSCPLLGFPVNSTTKLNQVQWKVTKTAAHDFQGGLRNPGLPILEKKRLGVEGDLTVIFSWQDGVRLVSEVRGQRARGNSHKLHPGDFSANIRIKKKKKSGRIGSTQPERLGKLHPQILPKLD